MTNILLMIFKCRACKYTLTLCFILQYAINCFSQGIVSTQINTVVIDPGHGGKDPGAVGKKSKEKDITLAVASKLRDILYTQHPNIKVVMTREDDVFVKLIDRADIANKQKADLFISIHVNSNNKKEVSGAEFWVLGLHKADENLDVVKKENDVVKLEEGDVVKTYGFDPNSAELNIILNMKQTLHLDKSIQLAKSIEKTFTLESNQLNRGTKQAGFVVLYKTNMPSVLVEIGFISNSIEEDYINSDEGQNEIAQKIANAFSDYKQKYESGALKNIEPETKKEELKSKIITEAIEKPVSQTSNTTNPESGRKRLIIEDESMAEISNKSKVNLETSTPKKELKNVVVLDDEIEDSPQFSSKPPESEKTNTLPTKSISTLIQSKPVKEESIRSKTDEKLGANPSANISKSTVEKPKEEIKKTVIAAKELEQTKITNSSKPENTKSNTPPKQSIKDIEVKSDPNLVPSFKKNEDIKQAILENAKELEASQKESAAKSASSNESKKISKPIPQMSSTANLVYKIQVKASAAQCSMDDPIFNKFSEVEESYENALYKYLIGNFDSQEAAQKHLVEVKSKGISDAFIVKYQNGVRIK